MRNLWALPALVRLATASRHSFSVHDDLLAYPQYEVIFSDHAVPDSFASARLSHTASKPTTSTPTQLSHTSTDLHRGAGSAPRADAGDDQDEDGGGIPVSSYDIIGLESQRYLCSFPVVEDETTTGNNGSSSSSSSHGGGASTSADHDARELARATDRGWELLQGMEGTCIYFNSGWWSYSFCYNDGVRQFHALPPSRGVPPYPPVEDASVQAYVLGRFPAARKGGRVRDGGRRTVEAGSAGDYGVEVDDEGFGYGRRGGQETSELARLETKGETRYMVQRLGGGTVCDLTGKERKIEVQFHCHPGSADRIGLIKEVSTCAYLMIIYTPRLCNDVAFLPPQENKPCPIVCKPIVPDDDVPASLDAHHHHHHHHHHDVPTNNKMKDPALEKDLEAILAAAGIPARATPLPPRAHDGAGAAAAAPPIIGGIAVGGHRLVGAPGKVIEKSVVAGGGSSSGGGKDRLLATVASSTGPGMTAEQLRQLDIRDPRDIERLKKELRKMAGGKGWKLELVDTPRGREFRGIIDPDEQQEEEEREGDVQEGGEKGRQQQQQQQKKKQKPKPKQQRPLGTEADGHARAHDAEEEAEDGYGEPGGEKGSEETYFRDEL